MMSILNRMREEDPTWVIEQSKELKQTLVHGQGEFHLRTLKWRLENNEKLQVKYEEPKIPYRETITKAARADYRHKNNRVEPDSSVKYTSLSNLIKKACPCPILISSTDRSSRSM